MLKHFSICTQPLPITNSISVPNFQMSQPISSPRLSAPSPILPTTSSTSANVTTNSNEEFSDDLADIDQDSLFGEF